MNGKLRVPTQTWIAATVERILLGGTDDVSCVFGLTQLKMFAWIPRDGRRLGDGGCCDELGYSLARLLCFFLGSYLPWTYRRVKPYSYGNPIRTDIPKKKEIK